MMTDAIESITFSRQQSHGLADILNKKAEFGYIPLSQIIVEKQVRSEIDLNDETFVSLVESIREKGVLEPILVKYYGDDYLLISGERRYRASMVLGLQTIPARIFDSELTNDQIIEIQLIENLHREDLNPLDEAIGYLDFCKSRGKQDLTVEQLHNAIIKIKTGRTDNIDQNLFDTIKALTIISGKSLSSLVNILGLLKLPQKAQDAIKDEKIGTTQGYILASNIDHPMFVDILEQLLSGKIGTKDALKSAFMKKLSAKKNNRSNSSINLLIRFRKRIERATIDKQEKAALISEIKKILALLEGQGG